MQPEDKWWVTVYCISEREMWCDL